MKTIGRSSRAARSYHIAADQSVREAARYMTERRVGAVVGADGDRLAGHPLGARHHGRAWWRAGLDLDQTRVGDVMTRDLVVARRPRTRTRTGCGR